MFTTLITLAAPWVLKNAIDDLSLDLTGEKLVRYAGLILGIAVTGGVLRFFTRRILIGASRAVEYELRNAFFAQLQRMPPAWFHAHRTGDLMSRAINDLNAVRMMIGPAIMYASTTGLTFVVALVFMTAIDVRLTLVGLAPLPLITIGTRYIGRAIHDRFERIQAQLADLSAMTQETLAGVRVVRAYREEARALERFRAANQQYVDRNRALIRLQGAFYPSMTLLMGIGEVIVLWVGARDVMAGRLTVGELVAFTAYLAMLAWPMIAFGWVTNLLQRGRASWGRMRDVLEGLPSIDDSGATRTDVRPEHIRGEIAVRHLTFGYDGRRVLEDVTFEVPAGTTVALIGPTGSGKSTLLALIARLFDPPPGTVFVDGIDVRTLPLATLRGALGVVPQDPFLFSATIAENVAFSSPDGGRAAPARDRAGERDDDPAGRGVDPRIVEVSRIARLDKDVDGMPDGYLTRVGERGITLSGGQKQRTALARALYRDPRILILDDAMSAVDTETEHEILSALRRARQGRTTLIVSHRVSTVRAADRIIVLDAGRVVESGTHDELVARGGAYAALHRQQQLESALAES